MGFEKEISTSQPDLNRERKLFIEEMEGLSPDKLVSLAKILRPNEDIADKDKALDIIAEHIEAAASPSELEIIRQKMNNIGEIEL